MNTLGNKPWHVLKPDAQAFDEIRISIVPRYKESHLSGDEWRISTKTEFWRKGKLIHTTHRGNMLSAAGMLYADFVTLTDDGQGYYAGEGDTCDQEGCHAPAEVWYALKAEYCRAGHETPCTPDRLKYRQFCRRHAVRGDCGLEDGDHNYITLPGDPNVIPPPSNIGTVPGPSPRDRNLPREAGVPGTPIHDPEAQRRSGGGSGESGQSSEGRPGPDYPPTPRGSNTGVG